MITEYPYWDISYLIAVSFVVGFSALHRQRPLLLAAARNPQLGVPQRNNSCGRSDILCRCHLLPARGCFSRARVVQCGSGRLFRLGASPVSHRRQDNQRLEAAGSYAERDYNNCQHHHQRARRRQSGSPGTKRKWRWPTWNEVKTHYIHEIGFVANMILATGATLFYITGICGLPGIYKSMSLGLARGLYWLAYLLGGIFFVISSALYVLETQST